MNATQYAPLFEPFQIKDVSIANRIVMAPMTRKFSPGNMPGPDVADYYRRRVEGGIGLIISEGIYTAHSSSGAERTVPRLTTATEQRWREVVQGVHSAGGKIFAQLWHVGMFPPAASGIVDDSVRLLGPSGVNGAGDKLGEPMTDREIGDNISAYGESAAVAKRAGFDGLELHGGHGYLLDQFFWSHTNRRQDRYGGAALTERTRFAEEVLKECRRRTGPDFPISFRFSQWKIQDYSARLADTPAELELFLARLVDAGADILHCSTRRYWEPEFPGSDMNLAGWAKKVTGMPTITVGSVTLSTDVMTKQVSVAQTTDLTPLVRMLERGEIDLVAVGRAVIANPDWPAIVRAGDLSRLQPFVAADASARLY